MAYLPGIIQFVEQLFFVIISGSQLYGLESNCNAEAYGEYLI